AAFIVAHKAMDTDTSTYLEHKVACRSVHRTEEEPGAQQRRGDCDMVLESDFLNEAISSFDRLLTGLKEPRLVELPYILDIDLDYFNTQRSTRPEKSSFFRDLARGASLITIATEP